jgi:hypothetical protein
VLPLIGIATVVTAALVALAVRTTGRARERRRHHAEAMEATAARLGWGYREEIDSHAVPDLSRFELFRQGSGRKLRHLLTSPAGDPRAVIFEYTYAVSNGKSTSTYRQTVYYATGDALRLPSFSLRPENFFHRVGAVFGYQDIDCDRRPEFSRMFLLRGEDEAEVRALFTEPVMAFFERRPGICAAGLGRELLVWRPQRVITPDELESFVAEGAEVSARLRIPTPADVAGARRR